jgi:hypothetical protein
LKTAALRDEYHAMLRQMAPEHIKALMRLGVPLAVIETICPAPARIILDRTGELYQPHETGIPGWTFPVRCADPHYLEGIEAGDPAVAITTNPIIDLVAFWDRGWALRRGVATSLGAISRQYDGAAPVRVYRQVLDWLRGSCCGIVLLTDEPSEAQRALRQCRWIEAEDAAHATELRRLIDWSPPPVDLEAAE